MVWDQGPGVALGLSFFEDVGEPFQKRLAVLVIAEDVSSFYPSGHDVLKEAGSVKSWLAGHGLFIFLARISRMARSLFFCCCTKIQAPELLVHSILRM